MLINKMAATLALIAVPSLVWGQTAPRSRYGSAEFKERMSTYRGNQVEAFDQFYGDLTKALSDGDYDKMADFMQFPMQVKVRGRRVSIKTKDDFIRIAKVTIDHNWVKLVLCEKDQLSCVSKGVLVGRGEAWFNTVGVAGKETWKLITINQ